MQEIIKAKLKEEIKQKKVYLVHGWGGSIIEAWFKWLQEELPKRNIKVEALEMPNPDYPKIEEWVSYLNNTVKEVDEETYFIGHSIGCQTILRYLQRLPESIKVAGCFFAAPWFNLTEEAYECEEDREIAKPWLETPISFEKVKDHTNNFVAIFSENDPVVPVSDAELFEERLGAKTIIQKEKGHFDEVTEIPEILDFLK